MRACVSTYPRHRQEFPRAVGSQRGRPEAEVEDGDQIPHLILPLRPRRPPAGVQLRPDAVRLQHAVNPQPSVNLEGAQAHAAALLGEAEIGGDDEDGRARVVVQKVLPHELGLLVELLWIVPRRQLIGSGIVAVVDDDGQLALGGLGRTGALEFALEPLGLVERVVAAAECLQLRRMD